MARSPSRWSVSRTCGGPSVSSIIATRAPIPSTAKASLPPSTSLKYFASAAKVVSLSDLPDVRLTRVERTLLRAIPPQRRIAVRAESAALRVYVMHLDVIGFAHKLEQFRAIVNDIANRPPARLMLVAGDLNTFGPPLWRKIRATAHDAGLIELTRGVRRTHWTAQKLDAIYAAGEVPSKHRAWTLSVRASDHLPVFAELR